jgi:hypothetical protein
VLDLGKNPFKVMSQRETGHEVSDEDSFIVVGCLVGRLIE